MRERTEPMRVARRCLPGPRQSYRSDDRMGARRQSGRYAENARARPAAVLAVSTATMSAATARPRQDRATEVPARSDRHYACFLDQISAACERRGQSDARTRL